MTNEQQLTELANKIREIQMYGTQYVYRFEQLDAISRCRAIVNYQEHYPYEYPDFSQTRFRVDGTVAHPRWK